MVLRPVPVQDAPGDHRRPMVIPVQDALPPIQDALPPVQDAPGNDLIPSGDEMPPFMVSSHPGDPWHPSDPLPSPAQPRPATNMVSSDGDPWVPSDGRPETRLLSRNQVAYKKLEKALEKLLTRSCSPDFKSRLRRSRLRSRLLRSRSLRPEVILRARSSSKVFGYERFFVKSVKDRIQKKADAGEAFNCDKIEISAGPYRMYDMKIEEEVDSEDVVVVMVLVAAVVVSWLVGMAVTRWC